MSEIIVCHSVCLASIVLISEWPVEDLRLVDIYPEGKEYLFSPSHKFDNTILLGLARRMSVREKCRMSNLDLRQFNLSKFLCINPIE